MIKSIEECSKILSSPTETVENKYDALFHLRSIPTTEACQALIDSYAYLGDSDFLKHDVMYALGQNMQPVSIDFLLAAVHNPSEAPIVRHEAAEALANFGGERDRLIPELRKYWDSDIDVLRSTVRLSIRKLERIDAQNNNFNKFLVGTHEPAEPFTQAQFDAFLQTVGKTQADIFSLLTDLSIEEYTRYQIMYFLRNKYDAESAKLVARLLRKEYREQTTPLMRHEVCFVLGQFSEVAKSDEIRAILKDCITDMSENAIVRHEAILCYSEIFGNDELIDSQKTDKDALIKESAYVVIHEKEG